MQQSTPLNPHCEELKRSLDSPSESSPEKPSKVSKIEDQQASCDEEEEEEKHPENNQMMNPNPRSQRYLVAIEYIGTRFYGSQKQPVCRTVVGVLEGHSCYVLTKPRYSTEETWSVAPENDAFHKFIGQPVSVICSSRTDAGVHALSNVCHVDVERISKRKPGEVLPPHEPGVVRKAVNHFLQKGEGDITVVDVRCVPADFHARYRAQERTYFYRMLSGPEPLSTFEKDRAWHVSEELDIVAMQNACKVLVGCHDFSSFRAAGCQATSPIRTLDELNITEVVSTPYFPSSVERRKANFMEQDPFACPSTSELELASKSSISNHDKVEVLNAVCGQEFGQRRSHRCYVITTRARSFLYHQVRLLVGVLKAVGTGDLTTCDVERILNAKTVSAASPMAPACGLYLGRVKYDLP